LQHSSKYSLLITKPWVYHSLFWLSYYLFGSLISLTIHQIYDARFYLELLTLLPPDMLLVYVNLYVLMPALLLRRKFVYYFTALLICISLISSLNILLHRLYALAGSTIFASVSDFNSRNFAGQFLNCIYLLALVTAIKLLKDWMLQKQQLQEKEKQQVATELNFLKSQVHPHFFFNTLNNLYSLTLQKSDLAPEVVQKLSDLMSYMLYESGAPLVPLDKEICNLENYIDLEKLRFGPRLSLSFEKEGVTAPVRIPPLILLAFVENSFKHGMNHTTGDGRIDISLKVQPDRLWFSIDNPVESNVEAAGEKSGIGLKNVIRRLDLLYGTRYQLDLSGTEKTFHVILKIPLP
jgi:two-component system LytT family sensor kinase